MTFDVGGTLIEPWPSVGHVYAAAAARHGVTGLSPEALTHRFAAAWRQQKDFQHTRAQWAALVDATFEGLVEPPPSGTFFSELYDRFTEPDAWHIFDDVLPSLTALRGRGLKLGIISNWDDRLRPLLRRLELDSFFDVIVVSCEVGVPKPARRIFERSAQTLGVVPGEILHLGDSLEMDFLGAQAAGFQARLLQRGRELLRPGGIRSLRDLRE